MAAGDVSQSMVAQVRTRIGEPAESVRRDYEIYRHLNRAQMSVALEEGLDAALFPLSRTEAGTWTTANIAYPLPVDFLRERFVQLNGIMARRIALLDMDAVRTNVHFKAGKAKPFYTIADAQLWFFTGNEEPDAPAYQFWYFRKPMRCRAVTAVYKSVVSKTIETSGNSGAVRLTNVATITTTAVHGLVTGQAVTIAGVTDTVFNGTYIILSTPTTVTFTYANTGTNGTSGSGTAIGKGTIKSAAVHGMTTVNIGDRVMLEGVVPGATTSPDGTYVINTVPSTTVLEVGTATTDAGTGGRMVHASLGQIAADEDPMVPSIFHGPMMDFATARCREQSREFDERDRQMAHYIQRLEALKSHYGTGRPHDGLPGDPGRRVAQGGQQGGG